MPVYHSSFNEAKGDVICSTVMLPLKTKVRGPAPPCDASQEDIVDEAIKFFRANVLHRNFKQEGPADLILAYLTVYVGEVIRLLQKHKTKEEGDSGFVLSGFFKAPASRKESDDFRSYFRQLREECGERMIDIVYTPEGTHNKWWMMFAKRKFMNIASTK